MSLDVYLKQVKPTCQPTCEPVEVYWANITHNLGEMAEKVGIYKHLWRPQELDITTAKQLIEPLTDGLEVLKAKPSYFEKFDSPNGWGTYEHFLTFVEKYLAACIEYPDALVFADR